MIYYIYCITNQINNKTYIGQRKCPANKTPETDSYMDSGKILLQAEEKYGLQNFSKSILAITGSKENVNILEKVFIQLYREQGKAEYNIANGGDGGKTYEWTDEMKNKFSKMEKGKIFSKETREKISDSLKCEKNHNFGLRWYNNGAENILSKECPAGFTKGMILKANPWNKGKRGIYSNETRKAMGAKNIGNKYTVGRKTSDVTKEKLRQANLGKRKGHWWTNGIINIVSFECPEGFHAGKTIRKNIQKN